MPATLAVGQVSTFRTRNLADGFPWVTYHVSIFALGALDRNTSREVLACSGPFPDSFYHTGPRPNWDGAPVAQVVSPKALVQGVFGALDAQEQLAGIGACMPRHPRGRS
jgi:hypothetical protein